MNSRNKLYHCPDLKRVHLIRESLRKDTAKWQEFMMEERQRVRAVEIVCPEAGALGGVTE